MQCNSESTEGVDQGRNPRKRSGKSEGQREGGSKAREGPSFTFTKNERMLGADWKAIIAYVLPWYKAAEKVSAYQTNPKIQAKLGELGKEKGTTWALFMAEEILKSQANLQLSDPDEDLET
jgi:hypothetical protein